MEYQIEVTHQYLRDLKLARKRNLDEAKLNKVIATLAWGGTLPSSNKDHVLTGNYKGYRECHVAPNWLLIYSRSDVLRIVKLVRTGSHSDLF